MGCIEELKYETLLSHASFKECRDFVKEHFPERFEVEPGYKIFDSYIIGIPPILVAVDGDSIVFPYTKPCHGTFLLRIECPEEVDRIRKEKKR